MYVQETAKIIYKQRRVMLMKEGKVFKFHIGK